MKIKIYKKLRDRDQHDWVLKYLTSEIRLTPDSYLWTRIKAHLKKPGGASEVNFRGLFARTSVALRWALPLILLITMSFGIYVGFELSIEFHRHTGLGNDFQQTYENVEMELIPGAGLEKPIVPLQLEIAGE